MQKILSNLIKAVTTSIIVAIAFVAMLAFIMTIMSMLFVSAFAIAPEIILLVVFIAVTYRVVVAMLTGK